jgi:hypothetical protein
VAAGSSRATTPRTRSAKTSRSSPPSLPRHRHLLVHPDAGRRHEAAGVIRPNQAAGAAATRKGVLRLDPGGTRPPRRAAAAPCTRPGPASCSLTPEPLERQSHLRDITIRSACLRQPASRPGLAPYRRDCARLPPACWLLPAIGSADTTSVRSRRHWRPRLLGLPTGWDPRVHGRCPGRAPHRGMCAHVRLRATAPDGKRRDQGGNSRASCQLSAAERHYCPKLRSRRIRIKPRLMDSEKRIEPSSCMISNDVHLGLGGLP